MFTTTLLATELIINENKNIEAGNAAGYADFNDHATSDIALAVSKYADTSASSHAQFNSDDLKQNME